MKFKPRDLGDAPIHWHMMIVVGSVFDAEGFASEGGVYSETAELNVENSRFGVVVAIFMASIDLFRVRE